MTAAALLGGAAALFVLGATEVEVTREAIQMGTYSRVTVLARDRPSGLALAGVALERIAEIEALLTNWREESEVSRLNRAPVGEWTPVSGELLELLAPAFELAQETGFAFDLGVGPLTRLWADHTPLPAERERARAASAGRGLLLDPGRARVCRLDILSGIDTGGFGKGAALDRAAEELRRQGVRRALLDLGGQALAVGGPFSIALADPRQRDRVVAVLRLQDASVSTTGNSERAFERGGERVGHVIDPRSGRPAADLGSVTVIARTALEADALSTALFVLGPKAGIAFAASRPGVEALYALALPEGRVRLHATSGFAHLLEEVDPRLEFVAGAAR